MKKLIALVLVAVLVASVVLLPINMAESGEGTTSTKTTVDTGDLTISKSLGTKAKYDSVTGGYSEEATGNDHSLYEHNL
ncbi:MAG: hypothetical protein FWG58_01745, partial [Methanomassiliicoccaceae archaeon]|nr:hypothetical protein [Methanomassiliicoccaceae archaeon]